MPLIMRRSSCRSTPRTSFGKWGSIRCHCSSLSQNKFLRTIPILPQRESVSYCHSSKINEYGDLPRYQSTISEKIQLFRDTPLGAERFRDAKRFEQRT